MPGVIGNLLISRTNRLLGASVSMLFGMRLSCIAVGFDVATAVRVDIGMLARKTGGFTSIEPMRPIQLLAMLAPRCGEQMKIIRRTSGRWLKMSDSSSSSLVEPGMLVSAGDLPK